jgi:Tfp pilus assembly protein PilO
MPGGKNGNGRQPLTLSLLLTLVGLVVGAVSYALLVRGEMSVAAKAEVQQHELRRLRSAHADAVTQGQLEGLSKDVVSIRGSVERIEKSLKPARRGRRTR